MESLYGMDVDGVECGRVVFWHFIWPAEPLWWTALAERMRAGPAAATVLIAAQLATGRARQDDMQELFDSFPRLRRYPHPRPPDRPVHRAGIRSPRPVPANGLGCSPSWRG